MDYSGHIRTLLRCLHRPRDIEGNAFALRLKDVLGERSAYAAFATAVQEAFVQAGEAYRLHRQILQRFDFERRVPRRQAAAELGVSSRAFFYLHAQAISIVERHIAALFEHRRADALTAPLQEMLLDCDPGRALDALHANGSQRTVEETLKGLWAAVRTVNLQSPAFAVPSGLHGHNAAVAQALNAVWFELRAQRVDALACVNSAQQMRFDRFGRPHAAAERAIQYAQVLMARHDGDGAALASQAKRSSSDLTAIEAALAAGDLRHADELVQGACSEEESSFRFIALVALRRTQIQLLSGEFAFAAQNAFALMHLAKPHADIAGMAAIVHARACVAMGSPLTPRRHAPHGVWYALYEHALAARSLYDEDLASRVFVRAACSGYYGIAAHAAATVSFVQNDVHRALDAWLLWLRGRHFEQGFDMMPSHLGRALLTTEAARRIVHELAQTEAPQWPVLPFLESSPASDVFWGALLDASVNGLHAEALAGIMRALLSRPITPDRSTGSNGPSPRRLAKVIAILLPFEERVRFVETFTSIMNYCNARARRRRDQLRGRMALELSG